MTDFMDHGAALETIAAPRSQGRRLAGLGQRLTQTFSRAEDPGDGLQQPTEQLATPWQDDMPRFAVVRHGYHCTAVDEYVAELEQELAELDREVATLRTQPPPTASSGVTEEIKRVGEQTSAVLIAAHEQAKETVGTAEAEAERKLAGAEAEATAIICRANQRLHELEVETQSVNTERERLLGDVRSAAAALSELVHVSFERFPTHAGSPAPETETEGDDPASDSSPVPV